jgi:hypothetical protein
MTPTEGRMMFDLTTGALVALALLSSPDTLAGRYTLDGAASDDPSTLAEEATRDLGRLKQNRARSELQVLLTPPGTLEITAIDSGYAITDDKGRSMRAVLGEPAREIKSPDGQTVRVDAVMRGDSLVVHVVGGRGSREQAYVATDTGLVVTTTYTVSFRKAPIRQRTVYRRNAE